MRLLLVVEAGAAAAAPPSTPHSRFFSAHAADAPAPAPAAHADGSGAASGGRMLRRGDVVGLAELLAGSDTFVASVTAVSASGEGGGGGGAGFGVPETDDAQAAVVAFALPRSAFEKAALQSRQLRQRLVSTTSPSQTPLVPLFSPANILVVRARVFTSMT